MYPNFKCSIFDLQCFKFQDVADSVLAYFRCPCKVVKRWNWVDIWIKLPLWWRLMDLLDSGHWSASWRIARSVYCVKSALISTEKPKSKKLREILFCWLLIRCKTWRRARHGRTGSRNRAHLDFWLSFSPTTVDFYWPAALWYSIASHRHLTHAH